MNSGSCLRHGRRIDASLDLYDDHKAATTAEHGEEQRGDGTNKDLREIVRHRGLFADIRECRRREAAVSFVTTVGLGTVDDAVVDKAPTDAAASHVIATVELAGEVIAV